MSKLGWKKLFLFSSDLQDHMRLSSSSMQPYMTNSFPIGQVLRQSLEVPLMNAQTAGIFGGQTYCT